ncbi:MAG: class I SAM-dependent methyltransferase [Almyronema sp.]
MKTIYTDGTYLQTTKTWHAEDANWKAEQINKLIRANQLQLNIVAEIGCGAGRILEALSKLQGLAQTKFEGYEISPQAIELTHGIKSSQITFHLQDLLAETDVNYFDLLLVIDVFEHVPDYLGFVGKCKRKAKYKIYHIPLDIHVSSVLRSSFIEGRYTLGHLHYFSAESAIATLKDTGHEILDFAYTNAALGLFKEHPSGKRAVANVFRYLLSSLVGVPLTARILGGYSLLVLAE